LTTRFTRCSANCFCHFAFGLQGWNRSKVYVRYLELPIRKLGEVGLGCIANNLALAQKGRSRMIQRLLTGFLVFAAISVSMAQSGTGCPM
jgi:hypothetical protein